MMKSTSRHCQMSPGGKNCFLRTTALKQCFSSLFDPKHPSRLSDFSNLTLLCPPQENCLISLSLNCISEIVDIKKMSVQTVFQNPQSEILVSDYDWLKGICSCSVAQLCPTLCKPLNSFVFHHLPKFAQIHIYQKNLPSPPPKKVKRRKDI